ncbi:MAG TPA: SDR family NAD(P)-dependent oxidoreductase [Thermoplasmata archaeon]|nr:SDR family NAD(P)-dependent oxidoreductase [Thermoplasmata archaeon]
MSGESEGTGASGPNDYQGKVALVVGASKGIGAATARMLGRRGARVVLSSRDLAGLDAVAREVRDLGGEASVIPVDLGSDESVRGLGGSLRDRFGRLDFAFNNAGEGALPADLAEVPVGSFDGVFRVSVRGTFLAMREEIPLLLAAGGGAIVNMSSTAGVSAFRGGGPYTAAKHAVIGLTKAAALDYAERKLRVNAVAPGPIETHRMKDLPESYKARAREAVPMRRLGTSEEVAEAVVWLGSDAARFVTGATLFVDGGRMAGWG